MTIIKILNIIMMLTITMITIIMKIMLTIMLLFSLTLFKKSFVIHCKWLTLANLIWKQMLNWKFSSNENFALIFVNTINEVYYIYSYCYFSD